jgi:Ni/Co efflux regulator RcnB
MAMRVLVLLVVLLGTPLLAWAQSAAQIQQQQQLQQQVEQQEQLLRFNQQRQQQQMQQQEQQEQQRQKEKYPRATTQRHPGDYCCRHCRANELPCGNSCLPPGGKKSSFCEAKVTCACSGKP